MQPLTPSQWVVIRTALSLEEPFETWELVKAHNAREDLPTRHYKTIATYVNDLVEKGYLLRTPGPGGVAGSHRHTLARPKAEIAAAYVDHFLDQLGDDPELLEIAERKARDRRDRPRKPAARR